MANHQSLPHHGKPSPALSLMLQDFTERKLRRRWEFTVNSPITLTDLGLYCGNLEFGPPAPTSGMVGLWDSSETLLTSATVLDSDVLMSGFKYHAVSSLSLE